MNRWWKVAGGTVAALVVGEMERAEKLAVPLAAEAGTGADWRAAKS